MVDLEYFGPLIPAHGRAELAEELDDTCHVGDLGHVAQGDWRIGQQRRAKYGEDRVLVGRGLDAAGERLAAPYE
jgi:hypothetical protein